MITFPLVTESWLLLFQESAHKTTIVLLSALRVTSTPRPSTFVWNFHPFSSWLPPQYWPRVSLSLLHSDLDKSCHLSIFWIADMPPYQIGTIDVHCLLCNHFSFLRIYFSSDRSIHRASISKETLVISQTSFLLCIFDMPKYVST